ncbi:MAG: LysM peptidoglycan-binding domain-containing protein [Firmicutes bacterium]|nr:LysM peptidoglycan-binding domain-containing protein [Bacillota bacterium]
MRKMVLLLVIAAVVCVPVIAEGAVRTEPLIISVSDKDFSTWQWRGDTEATRFVILSSRAQANQFLRGLPQLARKAMGEKLAEINFKRDVAVVAYLGETSGGYGVEIGQVNINDRSLLVKVGMQSPGKDDMVTMILTYPWDMVTLPRRHMPEGDFEFIAFNQHGEVVADQWMNLSRPEKAISPKRVWHTVRTGETLSSIAKHYGVSIESLLAVNPTFDRDTIWIGQKLRIPGHTVKPKTYTVRTGDSLWAIAKENDLTVEELMQLNSLTGYDLVIGQQLVIPSK